MEATPLFRYCLRATDDQLLRERGEQLIQIIRDHSSRHDFAQRIHVDEIAIETAPADQDSQMVLLIPFHKEYFPELAVLNRYIHTRAREVGLILHCLILPDGSTIPFRQDMP